MILAGYRPGSGLERKKVAGLVGINRFPEVLRADSQKCLWRVLSSADSEVLVTSSEGVSFSAEPDLSVVGQNVALDA